MKLSIVGASIPGTSHTCPGKPFWRNNQDSFVIDHSPNRVIGVICDGCGSGEHSEVGSFLCSRILMQLFKETVIAGESRVIPPWEWVQKYLWRVLDRVIRELGPDKIETTCDGFLFTIIGVIATDKNVCVFSFGDGVSVVNQYVTVLPSGEDNTPPYLMYREIGSSLATEKLQFSVETRKTKDVESVIIGSDGMEDLLKFDSNAIETILANDTFSNPDALRRYLARINKETVVEGRIKHGPLSDDTTIIAVRKEKLED